MARRVGAGLVPVAAPYRALWYAPVFVAGGWAAWRGAEATPVEGEGGVARKGKWLIWLEARSDRSWLLGVCLIALPALFAFLTVMPHLEHFPVNNPLNYRLFSPFSPATCTLVLLTGGGAVLLAVRRHWLLLAQLLWCELVIVQAPQAQPWHLMFLWPMVLLPLGRPRGADATGPAGPSGDARLVSEASRSAWSRRQLAKAPKGPASFMGKTTPDGGSFRSAAQQEQVVLALVWVLILAGLVFVSPLDARWVVSLFARLIA